MPEQSSIHSYLSWTKERIDEMDATLASLEAGARRVKADSQAKADQLIADLKKRRDGFQAKVKAEAAADKMQLESQWNGFEANVKTYFETVDKQIDQQQATFRDVAAAQQKAWREAADKLHNEAAKIAARSAVAEVKAGGKRILGGAECGLGGVTQGLRSRKPGGVGGTKARHCSLR